MPSARRRRRAFATHVPGNGARSVPAIKKLSHASVSRLLSAASLSRPSTTSSRASCATERNRGRWSGAGRRTSPSRGPAAEPSRPAVVPGDHRVGGRSSSNRIGPGAGGDRVLTGSYSSGTRRVGRQGRLSPCRPGGRQDEAVIDHCMRRARGAAETASSSVESPCSPVERRHRQLGRSAGKPDGRASRRFQPGHATALGRPRAPARAGMPPSSRTSTSTFCTPR